MMTMLPKFFFFFLLLSRLLWDVHGAASASAAAKEGPDPRKRDSGRPNWLWRPRWHTPDAAVMTLWEAG